MVLMMDVMSSVCEGDVRPYESLQFLEDVLDLGPTYWRSRGETHAR